MGGPGSPILISIHRELMFLKHLLRSKYCLGWGGSLSCFHLLLMSPWEVGTLFPFYRRRMGFNLIWLAQARDSSNCVWAEEQRVLDRIVPELFQDSWDPWCLLSQWCKCGNRGKGWQWLWHIQDQNWQMSSRHIQNNWSRSTHCRFSCIPAWFLKMKALRRVERWRLHLAKKQNKKTPMCVSGWSQPILCSPHTGVLKNAWWTILAQHWCFTRFHVVCLMPGLYH